MSKRKWVDSCDDPLGYLENKYTPRMGEKKAMRAVSLELAHYTHFCYIDNGLGDQERLKERTRDNCRVFQKQYKEIQGSLDYFERLIDSPADGPGIIRLSPGQELNEDMFMGG